MDHQRPASQKLPAGLAGVLNAPEENRDSAYFSSTDASSKLIDTSAASYSGAHARSHAGPGLHSSQLDKTPSPISTNLIPQPVVSPATSNMSVASMVSPTTPGSVDMRRFDRPQSLDSGPNSATLPGEAVEPLSRRESVDSRINQGFGEMRLGNSPYASHNQSTTSIHNTLQQQRNPRAGLDNLSIHRISNGYQPSTERNPEGHTKVARTAPAITGPATSTIARAAEPTKGQAWAFPEEEIQRLPSAASQSLADSRRSSIADSLASSQFTSESRLPPGQRRLDDGLGGHEFQRLSNASGEFPAVHHHTLQHKQLGDLQDEESGSHAGSQPYSRTPELRISHKLAERKRRTEMKELFEQLRDLMPQERGSKASKWEILTKAITEHQRQNDALRALQSHNGSVMSELDMTRRELAAMRMENNQLRSELSALTSGQAGAGVHVVSATDPYGRAAARPELPPLRSLGGTLPNGPESMTGVQYEQPRINGFRQPENRY
ncbi:Protein esc1 [Pleurostoma richardsiae]|uniref:Protein esc1 n=1 Tax=Pleurostoma richardsiae TaxID=41990 RepID=A0AA38RHB4_9PEZI|nr:Protein esc1 [Pleurostoma richardsiae]